MSQRKPDTAVGHSPTSHTSPSADAHNLNVVWIGSVLIGATAIGLFWSSALWRLALPLLAMVGYASYGMPRAGRGIQVFADSVYFMGFLWTIWALAVGILFQQHQGPIDSTALGRVFAYAVVTTGAGMFLRVALLQSKRFLSDQVDDARDDLEQRLTRLFSSLENVVAGLGVVDEEFKRRVAEASREAGRLLGESTTELASAISELRECVTQVGTELKALAADTRTDAGSARASFRDLAQAITKSTTSVSGAWGKAEGKITDLAAGITDSASACQQAQAVLKELPGDLSRVRSEVSALSGAMRDLQVFAARATTECMAFSTKEVGAVAKAMQDVRGVSEELQTCIEDVTKYLRDSLRKSP